MKTLLPLVALTALLAFGCQSTEAMMEDSPGEMESEMTEMSGSMEDQEYLVTVEVLPGSPTPLAPLAWAVHSGENPFLGGDMGEKLPGLEELAEDGNPAGVEEALASLMDVHGHGVAAVPAGSSSPGPATPGTAYTFRVKAPEGAHLSFATMYVQSNDLFFSPGEKGISLTGDMAMTGDVTGRIKLFDAGTEVNEEPGMGSHQAPRQPSPGSGESESRPVAEVNAMGGMYNYPEVNSVLRVTVEHGSM